MMTFRRVVWINFQVSLIVLTAFLSTGCPAKQQKKGPPDSAAKKNSTAPSPPIATEDDSAESGSFPGRVHTVEPKDTLFHLAEKYYGDRNQWRKIWQANKKRLPNPNDLPVGMKLIIP
jgi:nucleoid-associated protein YgaU